MRRILILTALLLLLAQSALWAQERPPLAMRIEFEWTALGALVGAGAGVALWLTDPGNPNFTISRSVIEGVGWGTILGAGFGLFVMQKTAGLPGPGMAALGPLDPSRRISGDPVRAAAEREDLLDHGPLAAGRGRSVMLPPWRLRF